MSDFDDRMALAKSLPIIEVAHRLHIAGLKRAQFEHVGPCPVCGGKDRFSINTNKNIFNCRICAKGGDQLALVELVQGCNFREAVAFLAGDEAAKIPPEVIAFRKAEAQKRQAKSDEESRIRRQRAVNAARNIWQKAVAAQAEFAENNLAMRYLELRGLTKIGALPPSLKCLSNHPYFVHSKTGPREIHRGPCMIAGIQATNGKVRAVHQTWLDFDQPGGKVILFDGDKPLPAKKVLGSKKGGAIRLSKLLQPLTLIIGEGIETTLTALQSNAVQGATYWAGVDLGNMAGRQVKIKGQRYSSMPDLTDDRAFVPPAETKKLIFIQDGDSDAKATRAKLLTGLRRAMKLRPGLEASIVHAGAGVDLNDLINSKGDLPNE